MEAACSSRASWLMAAVFSWVSDEVSARASAQLRGSCPTLYWADPSIIAARATLANTVLELHTVSIKRSCRH